jgi:hypothetical protein
MACVFLPEGFTSLYSSSAPAIINNQKIICLAVELKVINASDYDHTLSHGALSLQEPIENSLPRERFQTKFFDAGQQFLVVLEPSPRPGVPSHSRHAKSENRRSITGGVERVEF